ncbi:acetyl-CoA synthetase-like protein [Backusella circina FSU 941]|nr:acetyl-CoA synthetase-like protein [Backusella circina FSU 941]
MQSKFSIEVSEAETGQGPIHRSILSPSSLMTTPAEGVETLYDVLEYSAATYHERKAFGYRKLVDTIVEEKEVTKVIDGVEKKQKKSWSYFHLSGYEYLTYQEALTTAQTIGSALRYLGAQKGDKLQIFASTSVEWMLMAQGAFTQAMTIVTAYDTLGPEGLQHSISESEAKICFMNSEQLTILDKIIENCPTIEAVVYRGEAKPEHIEKLKSYDQVKNILSYEELQVIGKEHAVEPVKPKSEELCCIMYTSGSTGNPKGVMLTHGNVVAAVSGCCTMLQHLIEPNDSMMAYLPLAHVLEFLVENLCIFLGITLGYGSVRTLTNVSVRKCNGDLQEFAPTIMTGVPQVWETIRKTILTTVQKRGPRVEKIFMNALNMKRYLGNNGFGTGILNKVVFNTVKNQLGGRLRYCLSGGAPVSQETQDFLSLSVCPILAGYGMTESVGMCAIMAPEQFKLGEVGSPVPCVEVKLVDVPDANYFSTNTPRAQGEIWIRGPSITSGYFKRDDITKETITEDGWLKTGDIGEWTERGTLVIIDRLKNLVKLSNGEYIALEKLESVYKSCNLVENICVYADPLCSRPVALLVPIEKTLKTVATENGVESDWDALCENKTVRKVVLNMLQEQAKKSGLKGTEVVSDVWICKDMWTSEQGLLTAAQKLKRKDINTAFSKELKEMTSAQKQ